MTMDSQEVIQKVNSHLTAHPNAALQVVAEELGIMKQRIEQILREVEGASFEEFRENMRLEQALRLLEASGVAMGAPNEKTRIRQRFIIPRTTLKYETHSLWIRKPGFSSPCPLVDLSREGLSFLADYAPKPGKWVSLLLKFPGREATRRVEGRVVYAVATGIAGYRYRVGIKFLPFAERRGCNTPKVFDVLVEFEKTFLVANR
jgi:AraC-like DNA-binding protein